MLDNYVVSLIRTYVPVWVGVALTWLATTLGIVVDENTSSPTLLAAVGLVIAAYYALARAVEKKWPGLGGVLVALGLAARRQPVYAQSAQSAGHTPAGDRASEQPYGM